MQKLITDLYQNQSRQVYATLVRLLGNFELAEEALHDAFRAALEKWPEQGVPEKPVPWLISAGRFKAIDRLRRESRYTSIENQQELFNEHDDIGTEIGLHNEQNIEDDQLRLIFTCCHPALAQNVQIALTLREVCGLTTEQIAQAFLIPAPTLAQRIVRAKNKIRDANIPYQIPEKHQLPERMEAVLRVIYLVYNEGYSASSGEQIQKRHLTVEAIRLAESLKKLLPECAVNGLLALMLLNDSRQAARIKANGDLVPLEEQQRNLWDKELIRQGCQLVTDALETGELTTYSLQAAISAVHAEASDFANTDWSQIIGLYEALLRLENNPVIRLNQVVAIAMRDGAGIGLQQLAKLLADKQLQSYHLSYAVQADLLRRENRFADAMTAYQKALSLTEQLPEQRFLQQRIDQVNSKISPD